MPDYSTVFPQVRSSWLGPGCALGAALLFGISNPLAKIFLDRIDPWMLAGLLFVGAGIGLLPIYLAAYTWGWLNGGRLNMGRSIAPRDWGWLGASILAGGIAAPVLLMFGLANGSASAAALLLNFEGVFTVLLAWIAFGERLTWRLVGGIAAITAGGLILSATDQTTLGFSWGSLAILGTCLGWALDSNLTHKIADRNPLQLSLCKSFIAGAINVGLAWAMGDRLPALPLLALVLGFGFLSYGLTLLFFVLALRYIGAAQTGTFFALSPFVSAAIAVLVLGEQMTSNFLVAAILMAIGVVLCLSWQNVAQQTRD